MEKSVGYPVSVTLNVMFIAFYLFHQVTLNQTHSFLRREWPANTVDRGSVKWQQTVENLHEASQATSRRWLNESSPEGDDDDNDGTSSPTYATVLRFIALVILVLASGLFSGLTLGIMGLDTNQLKIVKDAGSVEERIYAGRIWPVRENGNLLLCTLLLGNVAVNALLSILMADLTSGLIGFVISTGAITIFGEILPQAACSRHALYIGSRAVPLVKVIIVILYVIAKPLSMILDKVLGEEAGKVYSKEEFDKLITAHTETLSADRRRIMQGALKYGETQVSQIMTPRAQMFSLKRNEKLSFHVMSKIFESGYSRIPVWDDDDFHIVGLLYAKDLILLTPREEVPVVTVLSFFQREYVPVVDENDTLEEVLKVINSEKVHFAAVRGIDNSVEDLDPVYKIVGCVTLEDILEEILQMEVEDEFDTASEDSDIVKESPGKSGRNRKRSIERQRLRILDDARTQNSLSKGIVRAATSTLLELVPSFKKPNSEGHMLTFSSLYRVVRCSQVLRISNPMESRRKRFLAHFDLKDDQGSSSSEEDEDSKEAHHRLIPAFLSNNISEAEKVWENDGYICKRYDDLSAAYLILEGAILITSGDDAITSTKRSFDIIASRALCIPEGQTYRADFSARIVSTTATLLKVEQAAVAKAYRSIKFDLEHPVDIHEDLVDYAGQGSFSSLSAVNKERQSSSVEDDRTVHADISVNNERVNLMMIDEQQTAEENR